MMSRPMHPIAGVVPPEIAETTVMTVWPSVASTGFGRALGRVYGLREGVGALTLGRLALVATIPVGLLLYLSLRLPWAFTRYRLTNRRVLVEQGVNPVVRVARSRVPPRSGPGAAPFRREPAGGVSADVPRCETVVHRGRGTAGEGVRLGIPAGMGHRHPDGGLRG